MNRSGRRPPDYSSKPVKSQIGNPHLVRERLHLKPRNTLRHRLTEDNAPIDEAATGKDDPFTAFLEWTCEADEKAYDNL